jgi:hypothetical protein
VQAEERETAWAPWALGLGFAAVYALLYPATYSVLDEQGYLSYALTLLQGTLHPDVAGVYMLRAQYYAQIGHLAASFPPGTSALIAPVVALLHWRASFACIGLVHLAGSALCAVALRRAGLPRAFALLYLLHPVAVLYSRTVMSDVPAMALTMAGVAAWLGGRASPALAGALLGASVWFRFAQLPLVAAFAVAQLVRALRGPSERAALLRFAAGAFPFVAALLAFNAAIYGAPLPPGEASFGLANAPRNLATHFAHLNLIYPLLLVVALAFPSALRLECALGALGTLAMYAAFFHSYQGFGALGQIVVADRFFLPLFALLCVPYAGALDALLARAPRWRPHLIAAGGVALAAVALTISVVHQQRLRAQAELQEMLYAQTQPGATIVCASLSALEYFFDGLGQRRVLSWAALDPGSGNLPALRAAIPRLYLVAAERTDQTGRDARGVARLLADARREFTFRTVASVDRPPDRVTLYQVTGLRMTRAPE